MLPAVASLIIQPSTARRWKRGSEDYRLNVNWLPATVTVGKTVFGFGPAKLVLLLSERARIINVLCLSLDRLRRRPSGMRCDRCELRALTKRASPTGTTPSTCRPHSQKIRQVVGF